MTHPQPFLSLGHSADARTLGWPKKKLALDELAIYAFEKDEEGVCTAEKLEVAEDGRVKGGLKDFFESHLDELNRYVKALQTRE